MAAQECLQTIDTLKSFSTWPGHQHSSKTIQKAVEDQLLAPEE